MKSRVLKFLMVVSTLHILIIPWSNMVAVLLGYTLLILSALLPMEMLLCSQNRLNKKQFFLILGFLTVAVCNSVSSVMSLSLSEYEEAFKAFISFFSFLFALAVGGMTYTKRDLAFYFSLNRFLAIAFILYTIIPFPFQYTVADNYGYMQFTLSMGNPNATATKVMFCVLLLVVQWGASQRLWERIGTGVLIAGLLYTIYMLESRTALICSLVGIVLGLVLRYRVTARVANLMWLVPVLFIPVQLFLEHFPLIRLLGKSLTTGREVMYSDFLDQIMASPTNYILGALSEHRLENYHNIVFAILFNFGIVGIVMYYSFWQTENRRLLQPTTKIANMAWIALMMFVIQSSSEAAALSGSFSFGIIVILLNRLTKDHLIDDEEEEEDSEGDSDAEVSAIVYETLPVYAISPMDEATQTEEVVQTGEIQ